MAGLEVLSAIPELPETGHYAATSVPKTRYQKKKLSRLHGTDPKDYAHCIFIFPPAIYGEKEPEKISKSTKKKELIIPKIVIEELRFPDDQIVDQLELRTEQSRGFLHPSYAIYAAVSANDPYALKNIILSGRVNVNRLNASGVTALHEAAYEGKSRCLEVLVQCGADVDIRDREGWTPLHAAVCGGNRKCVSLLLKNGADARAKNDDGLSPLGVAVQQGNKDMAEFVSSITSNFSSRLPRRSLIHAARI